MSEPIPHEYYNAYLEAAVAISNIFNEGLTPHQAMLKMYQTIRNFFGWDVMIIWKLNKKSGQMECIEAITDPPDQFPKFMINMKALNITEKNTLANKVFTSRCAAAEPDYGKQSYLSSPIAAAEGLKGALAYPIFEKGNVTGLIEHFKKESIQGEIPKEEVDFLNMVGIQLGQFLYRAEAEKTSLELSSIVNASQDALYSEDIQGNISSWNLGAEQIYGWKADEIIGQNASRLYPPNRLSEFEELKKQFLERKVIRKAETQRIRKDNTLIWVDTSFAPLTNLDGEHIGVAVCTKDISERIKLAEEIKRSEEIFRTYVETTEEWIWEMDPTGRYTYSNAAVQKILGFSPSEVIGRDFSFFLSEEDREKMKKEFENYIEKKHGWKERIASWTRRNHSLSYLETSADPILDASGKLKGFRGVSRDITAKMEIEKSKSVFISMVSHELRSPLSSIRGAIGLLSLDELISPRSKELLTIALRNCERLTHIINDILYLEKLELGKMSFQLKPIVLHSLVKEAVQTSQTMMKEYGVTVEEKDILPDVRILADPERLMQVLLNLLSNAFKYSPQGGKVTISMQRVQDFVRLSITDQGKGIPEEFKSKIFGKFSQATSAVQGTGLGLNISKSIIERLNGNIGFTSLKDVGTTFYFDLPEFKESSNGQQSPH